MKFTNYFCLIKILKSFLFDFLSKIYDKNEAIESFVKNRANKLNENNKRSESSPIFQT